MKIKAIPISWVKRAGSRLDAGPFVGGALEARLLLEQASFKSQQLRTLTTGFKGGLFTHQFSPKRTYVTDPQYGTPMLGASSMQLMDLSGLSLMSNRNVASRSYRNLIVRHGMTLASSSGIVGRLAYVRPDMDGMVSTGDTLKIQPDPKLIHPGYLFAFLSSRYGLVLVSLGTYGSIIQHLEPDHIADLPVPRLGEPLERKVHELIEKAASNRTQAARLRRESLALMNSVLSLPDMSREPTTQSFSTFVRQAAELGRLDAAFFSPSGVKAVRSLDQYEFTKPLGDVAEVFQTNIFKRPYVDDPQYGYPYFSGAELFTYDPEPRGFLRKTAPGIKDYIVRKDWLLMQDAGQLGGLIGKIMRVSKQQDMCVVSNHLIRIHSPVRRDSAYIFTLLWSPIGYRAVVRNAFGSSIPQLESAHLARIMVPWPEADLRQRIASPVVKSWDLEDEATDCDHEAIHLVEKAIEEAA